MKEITPKQLKTSTNKKLVQNCSLLRDLGRKPVSFGFFNPTWGARLKSSLKARFLFFYMVCVEPEKWVHNPSKSLSFRKVLRCPRRDIPIGSTWATLKSGLGRMETQSRPAPVIMSCSRVSAISFVPGNLKEQRGA